MNVRYWCCDKEGGVSILARFSRFRLSGLAKGVPLKWYLGRKQWFVGKVRFGVGGVFSTTGCQGTENQGPGKKWSRPPFFLVFPDFLS